MNHLEALHFIKNTTISVQAKINRKRQQANSPLENDLFDAAAAINQKSVTQLASIEDQDKQAKLAFDDLLQYVIKVMLGIN